MNILDNLIKFLNENNDLIKIMYSRETDIKYSFINYRINNGEKPISLQKTLVSFYKIRLPKQHTSQLLTLIYNNKQEIINSRDIIGLYNKYHRKFFEITSRNEISFTSKLLNLYNKNIRLYDSRVIDFLKSLENNKKDTLLKNYEALLDLYNELFENKLFNNELKNMKQSIYSKIEFKYIDLYKFFDTLMYSIGDTNKFKEINKIIV
jgi:hypothetical protein